MLKLKQVLGMSSELLFWSSALAQSAAPIIAEPQDTDRVAYSQAQLPENPTGLPIEIHSGVSALAFLTVGDFHFLAEIRSASNTECPVTNTRLQAESGNRSGSPDYI